MRPLSSQDIVRVWEQGQFQHDIDRALTTLAAACPDKTRDELAALKIGQRDAQLLTLREWTFGHKLIGYADCPRCTERLQFTSTTSDIRAESPAQEDHEFEFSSGDIDLGIRLPDSRDLAAAAVYPNTESARRTLLQRCVRWAVRAGLPVTCDDLPTPVVTAIAERVVQQDPQAEVQLDLNCVSCGHRWTTTFDIVSFFWSEIAVYAKRLLREVHALAWAYGWREADILALSPARRQFYLDMVT